MAEGRPAPQREGPTQPVEIEPIEEFNDFWARLRRVEAMLEECRQIIAELKEANP